MKETKAERYSNESQRKEVQKEIKLLENLELPNNITYFSSFSENGKFYNTIYLIVQFNIKK